MYKITLPNYDQIAFRLKKRKRLEGIFEFPSLFYRGLPMFTGSSLPSGVEQS